MRRSILHERERMPQKRKVRYLRVLIMSTNGEVLSHMSEDSVRIWAGYRDTKKIIEFKADGSREALDLEKIKRVPPPLPQLPSLPSAETLPHIPNYRQLHF